MGAWIKAGRGLAVWLAVSGLALLIVGPILGRGLWPSSHEQARYALLVDHFRDALGEGIIVPRWLPELYGGYGYPTFVFYQPAFFYLASGFRAALGSSMASLTASVATMLVVGGLGAYRLGRQHAGRGVSLAGALMFLLTPYLFVNLFVRGDLSELMAMMLCPWPLVFLGRLRERAEAGRPVAGALAGASLSLAMVVLAHPLVAFVLFPVAAAVALAPIVGGDRGWRGGLRPAGWVAMAFAMATAVSAFYWAPVLSMRHLVNLEAAFEGYFVPSLHLTYPHQFFANDWGHGATNPGFAHDGMSQQLGLPHALLAALGAFWAADRRAIRAAFLAYLALILMMSPASAAIWDGVEALRPLQFPWRLLGVTATLQVLCIAGLSRMPEALARRRAVLLPAAVGASALWYSPMFENPVSIDLDAAVAEHRESRLDEMPRLADVDEFRPLTTDPAHLPGPRGRSPMVVVDGPGHAEPMPGDSPHRVRYRVRSDDGRLAVINQLYLPGWRVEVDGRSVPRRILERSLGPDGRIRVPIPAGRDRVVVASYEGPPKWKANAAVGGIAILAIAGLAIGERLASRRRTGGGPGLAARGPLGLWKRRTRRRSITA